MNKSNRRVEQLDALEARLSGPKRIALFGHRNVGKTTLARDVLPSGVQRADPGPPAGCRGYKSAEYLAEKIAQLESGQPMAGSLAETELKLRLYHGPARFDLIVKDYQGEHVTLGSEEPIQEFFAGCDAVLLCLDPEGSRRTGRTPAPAARSRKPARTLYRSLRRSEHGPAGRALLTKFDRVLAKSEPKRRSPGR